MSTEITRGRFLQVAAAGTAWFALVGTLGCEAIKLTRASAFARGPTSSPRLGGDDAGA